MADEDPIQLDSPTPTWSKKTLPAITPRVDEVRLPESFGQRIFVPHSPPWAWGRELFLRGVGVIYLLAFASLASQVRGLFGERGIVPVAEAISLPVNGAVPGFWQRPTIFAWIGASDATLVATAWLGAIAGVTLALGIAPMAMTIICWFLYLSFELVGEPFLSFQWDALLLETGVLAILAAPGAQWLPRARARAPLPIIRWLIWFLLFRFMLLSGGVKLASGDPSWRDGSALWYHWWTQPLPNPLSWSMGQLPMWLDRVQTWAMFVIEIGLPWGILLGRWGRRVACAGLLLLQVLIFLTGNYGYFNLLTIVLILTLLDDGDLRALTRRKLDVPAPALPSQVVLGTRYTLAAVGVLVALFVAIPSSVARMWGSAWLDRLPPVPNAVIESCWGWGTRWRLASAYGLFAMMTKERPELSIEASMDGRTWKAYVLPWKPGPLERMPGQVAPFMPRLDWQLWFAALRWPTAEWWQARLEQRLLDASPDVLALFSEAPFGAERPALIRWRMEKYQFTQMGSTESTQGAWWRVTERSPVTGSMTRGRR